MLKEIHVLNFDYIRFLRGYTNWEASAVVIRRRSVDSVVISLVNNPVRRSILSGCSPRAVLLANRFRNRRIAVNTAR